MKRKPDAMLTLVIVFCIGLVISGFTTFNHDQERPEAPMVSLLSGDSQETN